MKTRGETKITFTESKNQGDVDVRVSRVFELLFREAERRINEKKIKKSELIYNKELLE